MNLFANGRGNITGKRVPLADRMRPRSFDEFIGQTHLVGLEGLLRQAVRSGNLFSMVLWGPPGCGKTTLARIIAKESNAYFETFSAVLSGVKDIRAVIDRARARQESNPGATILFVDEIHRFNKAQQDAFLPHVENGLIILIGATTENPSFEVIAPLLSRLRILVLYPFSEKELKAVIMRALRDRIDGLGDKELTIERPALDHLARSADGDARTVLNNLEISAFLAEQENNPEKRISVEITEKAVQRKALLYDKSGEEHYNLISAFHKSLRGSDPDAALYWLGRMLMGGEDPLYIARRMVRFASEDIGLADPGALTAALSAMEAYRFVGSPEGELALAQAAVYLATAPKSNALYLSMGKVKEFINRTGTLPVPLHLRNAPTTLMKKMGYGRDYKYAHDYAEAQVQQTHLPEEIKGHTFYFPTERGREKEIKARLSAWKAFRNNQNKRK
ncbi:MAG: replication-associated recombination protein A [Syntrophales bacterium]|nr:replication-associated recombination protein A [Syntrophales bacterium]